jgi:hypothetical protein
VALVAVVALGLVACRVPEKLPPADATYTVRGEVMAMPSGAGGELSVHHEAVPEFRDRQGKPEPMESMSMPFTVADGVSLTDVSPGDKVEMTFEVRWEADPTLRVVKLAELPAETTLALDGPTLELVAPLGASPSPTP